MKMDFYICKSKDGIMVKVISKDSINKANTRLITRRGNTVTLNSSNASMVCRTSFGKKEIVISRTKIADAAASAMKNMK